MSGVWDLIVDSTTPSTGSLEQGFKNTDTHSTRRAVLDHALQRDEPLGRPQPGQLSGVQGARPQSRQCLQHRCTGTRARRGFYSCGAVRYCDLRRSG